MQPLCVCIHAPRRPRLMTGSIFTLPGSVRLPTVQWRRRQVPAPSRRRPTHPLYDFCRLSPPPTHARPGHSPSVPRCAVVRRACFEGEQIFLHGASAQRHKNAIDDVLANAADPYNLRRKLRPQERNITHVARPGAEFSFLPLAIRAQSAVGNRSSGVFRTRRQPTVAAAFSNSTAIAFVTTWSQSFAEAFERAGTQLFEEFCSHGGDIVPIPAAWGLAEKGGWDSADTYVAPLGRNGSWPMSLKPTKQTLEALYTSDADAICGGRPCLAEYFRASEAFFKAKGQLCFETARVCDFQHVPNVHSMRPWSFMQAVAARHIGRPPWWSRPSPELRACRPMTLACPLQVVIIRRPGRRRLHHLDELLTTCNEWRPRQSQLAVECSAHDFSGGLVASLPLLRRTDVLIGSHGADMINALAMHPGASVVEVMPPINHGCPCNVHQWLFSASAEAGRILPYVASTQNRSYAVPWGAPAHSYTYNSDILLPASVIPRILERVVEVDGRLQRYMKQPRNFSWS